MTEETADGGCIICPHCSEEMGDCWEWVHEEPTENECSYCQKKIIVWADYDVTYRARATQTQPPSTPDNKDKQDG